MTLITQQAKPEEGQQRPVAGERRREAAAASAELPPAGREPAAQDAQLAPRRAARGRRRAAPQPARPLSTTTPIKQTAKRTDPRAELTGQRYDAAQHACVHARTNAHTCVLTQ